MSVADAIPITGVARVLLDLALPLPGPDLTRACREAWVRHRTTAHDVEDCIARNPRKPGAAHLRRAAGDVALGVLEDAFLALLRRHGLALPRTNVGRAGDSVECRWPHAGVTVELVGPRVHASARHVLATDAARRPRSRHVAFTYGDIAERPAQAIAQLAPLIGRRSAR